MWHVPLLALTNKRVTLGVARYRKEDIVFLKELVEAGAYRAVIDRTYPLHDAAAAIRYMMDGQASGKVVIASPT